MTQTSSQTSAVAESVRDQASEMNQTVTASANDIAHEAKHQTRSAVHDLHQSLRDRADQETSKLSQTLHSAAQQMSSMADHAGEQSFAASMIREGGRASERLASHLDDGGLDRLMGDARGWARRNPGGFLLGAAVAGFFAGRLARNFANNSNGNANGNRNGSYSTPRMATTTRPQYENEYEYASTQLSEPVEGLGSPGAMP